MLLTAVTGFCTTDPPGNGRVLPYAETVPYLFLLGGAYFALAAVTIGSVAALLVHQAKMEWFHKVRHTSRPLFHPLFPWRHVPFFEKADWGY